jgi:protein ImuB
MYLWLPQWPIDRRRSRSDGGAPADAAPFAIVAETAGRHLLAAVNGAAAAAGLAPGMPLADALSFLPELSTAAAEPEKDAAALRRLAEWCIRYSPWTAPDGSDGIRLEIAGSAHLWGGEEALAADLAARLGRRRILCRIAVADTLGAAWGLARFAAGRHPVILPTERLADGIAGLPVEALRLDSATAATLWQLGLKTVGDLLPMPRDALARRFGDGVARQLDRAVGRMPEPLSPMAEVPARRVRLAFADPIADPADLRRAIERLADDLVLRLAREGAGARRLDLAFYRIDGRVERIHLGTARPSRDPRHLVTLFAEKLDTVDPGLGIEEAILAAFAVEPLPPEQLALGREVAAMPASRIAPLLDRLASRLGGEAICRLEPHASHIPERASRRVPAGDRCSPNPAPPGNKPPRPVRLFEPPQPIEASSVLPDEPPFRFVWRRRSYRVREADGPERIAEEWWRPPMPGSIGRVRDYYRVEDEEGRRFWLFRAGLYGGEEPPRWYLHGLFA